MTRLDVAYLPSEARRWPASVCILIDVLRATSTIVTLLDRGCPAVIPVGSVVGARLVARDGGYLLIGERGGLAPGGFDFSNSPADLARSDLAGRPAVLTTSNGTAALRWLAQMPVILAGSLLNASASCRAALSLAALREAPLGIVCAGLSRRFALDDAVCAGFLVDSISRAAEDGAQTRLELSDAALAARQLWRSYAGDALAAFRSSGSGQHLAALGRDDDVVFCARTDVSGQVPVLVRGNGNRFER